MKKSWKSIKKSTWVLNRVWISWSVLKPPNAVVPFIPGTKQWQQIKANKSTQCWTLANISFCGRQRLLFGAVVLQNDWSVCDFEQPSSQEIADENERRATANERIQRPSDQGVSKFGRARWVSWYVTMQNKTKHNKTKHNITKVESMPLILFWSNTPNTKAFLWLKKTIWTWNPTC